MAMEQSDDFIYGRRILDEFLRAKSRKIKFAYLTKESAKIFKSKLIKEQIGFKISTKEEIFKLAKRKDHQGVFAWVEPFKYFDLSYVLDMPIRVVVALDGVQDVRNFGSIIRTVYLAGADCVIIQDKGSAKVNPVVVHASAGASEHIPIVKVDSLAHSLHILKQRGFTVLGASLEQNSIPFDTINYSVPLVIVFGNEGKGLSSRIKKICDKLIHIPQKGLIDSFNVSVACGIIIYYAVKKINDKN